MSLRHNNRDRKFKKGEVMNARPTVKSHRFDISESHKELGKKMKSLVELFQLSEVDIYNIIKREFGEGVGYQTTRMFMDPVYGPGFRPRALTLDKYRYLVKYLSNLKKQFAKPSK